MKGAKEKVIDKEDIENIENRIGNVEKEEIERKREIESWNKERKKERKMVTIVRRGRKWKGDGFQGRTERNRWKSGNGKKV